MYNRGKMTRYDSLPWTKKRRHNDWPEFLKKWGNHLKGKFGIEALLVKLKVNTDTLDKEASAGNFDRVRKYIVAVKKNLEDLDVTMKKLEQNGSI